MLVLLLTNFGISIIFMNDIIDDIERDILICADDNSLIASGSDQHIS